MRRASLKLAAPSGMTMNSCRSTELSACAPPFRMFIIGTGSSVRAALARIARQIAVERQAFGGGGGAGRGHGDGQDGVGAEAAFGGRAVGFDHAAVEGGLVGGVEAGDGCGDRGVDVFDGAQHAFAEVARLVAVAQFQRFVLAGGGARGHGGASARAVFENDVGFDGGIAAGIENLPPDDARDLWTCRLRKKCDGILACGCTEQSVAGASRHAKLPMAPRATPVPRAWTLRGPRSRCRFR